MIVRSSVEALNSLAESTDAELLERTCDGEREAFGALVDRYKGALVGYLTRLVGHQGGAEDLAQEAFLRFYENRERYIEQGNLAGYLYTIATNLVRTRERQRSRRRVLRGIFLPARRDGSEAPQQAALLVSELKSALGEAMAGLPVHYRVPLVLHELEGWSYKEIGAFSRCREGTVKSRVFRGRQLLKQRLGPYWRGEPSS